MCKSYTDSRSISQSMLIQSMLIANSNQFTFETIDKHLVEVGLNV